MIIIREHINNHTSPLSNANYSLASVAFASINHHFPDLESQSSHVNQPDKHCSMHQHCRTSSTQQKGQSQSAGGIESDHTLDGVRITTLHPAVVGPWRSPTQPGGQARSAVQGTSEVDLCFQRMILARPFLDRTQFAGRPNPLRQPAANMIPGNFPGISEHGKNRGPPG